jgi:mono/diheme cytochrome c family protein
MKTSGRRSWIAAALCVGALGLGALAAAQDGKPADEWKAPARAAKKKNPVASDEKSIAAGKEVYTKNCFSCHGPEGKGDGPAAKDLEKRPGNLSDPKLWAQTDGALFWKVTEGRKPMPTFEKLLSEEERWSVINYVRTLAPKPAGDGKDAGSAEKKGGN